MIDNYKSVLNTMDMYLNICNKIVFIILIMIVVRGKTSFELFYNTA